MNKIIVPTGYMGSGSSAVTDLISEYKNAQNDYSSYEYIFLHCPNGVFDLEDKLLIGNNAVRSDEAIRSFELQMNKLYDKKFWWVGNYKKIIGLNFKKYTDDFISSIQQFNYNGFWYMHEEVNTKMFIKLLIRKPFKMLSLNKGKFKKILKYNDGMRISFINEKVFYDCAKKYIYNIVNYIRKENKDIVLDQFLLPFNLFRIDNYFNDDLKVIVVSRDPRDVFIQNKYFWQDKNLCVPIPLDVHLFCEYYKGMRKTEKIVKSNKILRINFEDLIYNYDLETKKIEKFLGYSEKDHINKFKRFDPKVSIKNTQVFRNKKFEKEIKVIEKELKDYLYSFDHKMNNDIEDSVRI